MSKLPVNLNGFHLSYKDVQKGKTTKSNTTISPSESLIIFINFKTSKTKIAKLINNAKYATKFFIIFIITSMVQLLKV